MLDNYFELKNKEKFIKIIINIIFINNVFYIIKYIYNIIIVFFLFTSTLVLNNSFEYFFSSLFHFLFKSFLSKCSKLFSLSLYSISDSSFISINYNFNENKQNINTINNYSIKSSNTNNNINKKNLYLTNKEKIKNRFLFSKHRTSSELNHDFKNNNLFDFTPKENNIMSLLIIS